MMTSPRLKTNATGQLRPLRKRMSAHEYMRRGDRIAERKTAIDQLTKLTALTYRKATALQGRGFWGRLKWLLFGR